MSPVYFSDTLFRMTQNAKRFLAHHFHFLRVEIYHTFMHADFMQIRSLFSPFKFTQVLIKRSLDEENKLILTIKLLTLW